MNTKTDLDGNEFDTCLCEGENPDWNYHHPTGCGKTAQAFRMVSPAMTIEAWDEPHPPKDSDYTG